MPTYQVNSPDGHTYSVTAPAGTSPADVLKYVQQQHVAAQSQQPQQTPAQQPQQTPPAAPSTLENIGNMAMAAGHGALDAATFGLDNKLIAGIASGVSQLTDNPMSYDQALATTNQNQATLASRYPLSAAAGDVAGMVVGAGKIADAAKALRYVPGIGGTAARVADALVPTEGATVSNIAKSAATGGASAGAYSAVNQAARTGSIDPVQTGIDTFTGALIAPPVSAIGTAIARGVQSTSTRAMMTLASHLDMTPNDLASAFDNFKGATGRVPTMAELLTLKSQGELQNLARNSPTIQSALNTANDTAGAQRAQSLAQIVQDQSGTDQTDINTLMGVRKANADAAMAPIRNQTVPLDDTALSTLQDPRVSRAVRATQIPDLVDKYGRLIKDLQTNGQSSALTVDDMDALRQAVRGQQSIMSNPNSPFANSQGAVSMGNLADDIASLVHQGDTNHPYAQMLEQYTKDSNFITGYTHGAAGRDVGEAKTQDVINALGTQEGQEGYTTGFANRTADQLASGPNAAVRGADTLAADAGGETAALRGQIGNQAFGRIQKAAQAESQGAAALRNITGRVPAEPEEVSPQHIAQGAAALAGHSIPGIMLHATRAIPKFAKLSEGAQKVIAQYLADPSQTERGIMLLRKAGATSGQIRRFSQGLSAATGLNAANTMDN